MADDEVEFTVEVADGDTLIVAVNVRDEAVTLSMPVELRDRSFTDALSDETIAVGEEMSLAPYEYRLLTSE